MPFREKSRLDASRVEDQRGRGMGTTLAVGGGGIGIVVLLLALVLGANPGDLMGMLGGSQQQQAPSSPMDAEQGDYAGRAVPDGGRCS